VVVAAAVEATAVGSIVKYLFSSGYVCNVSSIINNV